MLSSTLEPCTPYSVLSVAELKRRLSQVRKQRFSVNRQGFEEGVTSIAAPILDKSGFAIGAISIACPSTRVDAEAIGCFGPMVREAALNITAALSGKQTK